MIAAARMYTKLPINRYHQCINEEAGRLAMDIPVLLTQRADLLKASREAVHVGGYTYTKGKSRGKTAASESDTGRPERLKLDRRMRREKTMSLEEDVAALSK